MLGLASYVSHCIDDEKVPATSRTWFLCDRLFPTEQRSLAEPLAPHHHTASRVTFEPILVQMGLITTLVFLVGRLLVSASLIVLRPISAPPTPPPRAA